jgi:acetoin utilization deacetylase AcuC-like enzyme
MLPQKWLALGGGGYDIQAVARSWALAYAVMSEQALPDEIPESYENSHGVETLSDAENISVTESVEKDVKAFAESSVTAIQRLVFPLHRIPTA